jgi:hypothetical protein
MSRRYVAVIGLVLLVIVATLIILAFTRNNNTPITEPTPVIIIEPGNVGHLAVNDTFAVNVTVQNCTDIYAVQVDIRYDPRVLNVTNISEGTFLSSTGPTFHNETAQLLNTIPLTARIFFVDTKISTNLPDASGNGTLFAITFRVLSEGSTQINFISYPGGNVSVGTYFEKRDLTVIIPEFNDGSYG